MLGLVREKHRIKHLLLLLLLGLLGSTYISLLTYVLLIRLTMPQSCYHHTNSLHAFSLSLASLGSCRQRQRSVLALIVSSESSTLQEDERFVLREMPGLARVIEQRTTAASLVLLLVTGKGQERLVS